MGRRNLAQLGRLPAIGSRFGPWTVIGESYREDRPYKKGYWITPCRCDCGAEKGIGTHELRGGSRPGGCVNCSTARHGHFRGHRMSPEYATWTRMRRRCNNPHHATYPDYGGRGITVCPEWADFVVFLRDMGPKPFPEAEIDRIDNDGPYAAWNCRWSTHQANTNNTRRNVWLEWDGRRQTVAQWARELGIDADRIHFRLAEGWSIERALTEPLKNNVYVEYEGRRQTIAEWSRETGIDRSLLSRRVRQGKSPEEILAPPRPRQPPSASN